MYPRLSFINGLESGGKAGTAWKEEILSHEDVAGWRWHGATVFFLLHMVQQFETKWSGPKNGFLGLNMFFVAIYKYINFSF